jgi:ECF transporter S component (folate family)
MRSKVSILLPVALLVGLEIVLSRFCSVATPIAKLGFGFVPIAICGIRYGPLWAAAAGGLADFIGAILFPIGAYFPGFTLSAALTGWVFGLFLARYPKRWGRLLAAVGINCLGVSLLLGTLWLTVITGSPFMALLPTRLVQNLIMIPVQVLLLRALCHPIALYSRRLHQS